MTVREDSAQDSRARAHDSETVPQAADDVELSPIEVVRDLDVEDRLAVVRARAVDLMEQCPKHVPRSEHGYPIGRSNCECVPERGFRVGLIRRLMEDHYWLADGAGYDRVLGDVFGLSPGTIRNDSSVAAMNLRSTEDPQAAEQRKRDGTNRTEDWAHEAWALGDRRTAAVLNEQALKASRAITSGTSVQIDVKAALAMVVDFKAGVVKSPELQAHIDAEIHARVRAAIDAMAARIPMEDRQAAREAAWTAAAGVTAVSR